MGCCLTLNGIIRDNCSASLGGIVEAYIACFDSITSLTKEQDEITAISTSTPCAFKKYQFKKETGNFITTINTEGNLYYTTDIVLQFSKLETLKKTEIEKLALSEVVVIIKTADGKFWYFGENNPVTLSAGDANSGTAWGDFTGYNVTLNVADTVMPSEVDETIIDELINCPEA